MVVPVIVISAAWLSCRCHHFSSVFFHLCLVGQTVFDLATDSVMKQVLEGSVHPVSVPGWVLPRLTASLCVVRFFSLSLSGDDSPCQEVRRTPAKGAPRVTDDHND